MGEVAGRSPLAPLNKGGDKNGTLTTQSQGIGQQSAPSLDLHIERLNLHGFSALDRHRIGAAMQAELTRLLAEQGIPPALAQGGVMKQLDGGTFEMAAGMPPRIVGVRIARAIYGGLDHG